MFGDAPNEEAVRREAMSLTNIESKGPISDGPFHIQRSGTL
jgi:hypothetical protein